MSRMIVYTIACIASSPHNKQDTTGVVKSIEAYNGLPCHILFHFLYSATIIIIIIIITTITTITAITTITTYYQHKNYFFFAILAALLLIVSLKVALYALMSPSNTLIPLSTSQISSAIFESNLKS